MGKTFRICLILVVMMVSASLAAEIERCVMTFSNCPQDFNNDTILVPEKVVAIAPSVLGCKDTAYIDSSKKDTNSFFFIIDNSGSMKGDTAHDPEGARFTVPRALLDTIYKKQPNAQVGVAVFQGSLSFDPTTTATFPYSSYFQRMSQTYDNLPDQAYLQLITLNQLYNGVEGIKIVDSVLSTTGTGKGTELRYRPRFTIASSTNINIAFLAAREAFATATAPAKNQYIIFLSDGEANRGWNDPGVDSIWYFRDSTRNVPTTFTVYFNAAGTIPPSIDTMTKNIKGNGYSASNPNSACYTIAASYNSLMNVLMTNVINRIGVPATPIRMVINDIPSTTFANGSFVFPDSFMLESNVTRYTMITTYQYTKPGTTTQILISDTTVFFTRYSANATQPPGINFVCTKYTPPVISIPVTATALDTNHEGHLDRIDITWTDTALIRTSMPSIAEWIRTLELTNLDGTRVNLQAATIVPDIANKTIHIILTENTTVNAYETGWQTATFTLTDTAMSRSGRPFAITDIVDGAAPVIKSICFVPSLSGPQGKDTLRVYFSEQVSQTNKPGSPNRYFSLADSTGKTFSDTADPVLYQGDRLLYVYHSELLNDLTYVKEGGRPLLRLQLCGDVSVVRSSRIATNPFTPRVTPIPSSQRDPKNPSITTGTRIEISLIPSVAKDLAEGKITATISIFDAVGNTIFDRKPMSPDVATMKLIKTWDGVTSKGTFAGGGTYMARIVVEDHGQGRNKTQTIRKSIGVKQEKK
jgi:hypothetical protein